MFAAETAGGLSSGQDRRAEVFGVQVRGPAMPASACSCASGALRAVSWRAA
ncbi:hypothetical protein [Paenibacillus sp. R14(2021)]|uniref:hypothetical protein n=1 Tax=Paenibacillus sp. R14(2021) TaxID=2859228 RepID=UPI001C615D00|nr:hypothetical protein [Paenibacillus sp. R14(2021)]